MKAQYRILAVDDTPVNLRILEKLLGTEYNLKTAAAGEEAIRTAVEFRPDLILLDIMMPDMDGYEVCRQIRAIRELLHTKIIMVSAKTMTGERLMGYEAGANDYITTPYDKDELLAKVRIFLQLKSSEEVDQLVTRLLNLLCHETRTPLNGLLTPAEMLMEDEDLSREQQKTLAGLIYNSTKRLHKFIESVMLLSDLKYGKREMNCAPVDPHHIIHQAVREVSPKARQRDVDIEVKLHDRLHMTLDSEELIGVMVSLLDNAVRFSPSGSRITVEMAIQNEKVRIRVTDQGSGIAPENLPHIFDEFSRNHMEQHTDGFGLSLAIAREIVKRHNGHIWAENGSEGGAVFLMEIPLSDAFESNKMIRSEIDAISIYTASS